MGARKTDLELAVDVSLTVDPDALAEARDHFIDQIDNVALLMLDVSGHVLTWNKGAERIKGWRAQQIIGQHISAFYTPEANAVGHPQRELELAALTGSYTEEGWRVRRDSSRFWAQVTIFALRDDEGEVTGFGKVTMDLTNQRQKDEQIQNVLRVLEQTMRIDHLTGLPNRRAWDEEIAVLLERALKCDEPLTVAFLDLDHFKDYNDRNGHLAGDSYLKRASLRWRSALRPGDLLARYGGEEFVVALPGCAHADAEMAVTRLMAESPVGCTLSAGLATFHGDGPGQSVLDRADRALYSAKDGGRDQLRWSVEDGAGRGLGRD